MKNLKKCSPWSFLSLVVLFVFLFSQGPVAAEPKKEPAGAEQKAAAGRKVAAVPRVMNLSYKAVRLVKDTLFPGCNGATIGTMLVCPQ